MTHIPIIRLEIEGMKHTILTALSEHQLSIDESLKKAIDEYCKPDNIDSNVRKAALDAIDSAVKEEVRNFFQYSATGRKAVKEAVLQHMEEWSKPERDQ